jgi:hypothetical protein
VTAPLLLLNVPLAVNGPPLFLLALIWIVATSLTIAIRGERGAALRPTTLEVTA